jgi:hypothetical protein
MLTEPNSNSGCHVDVSNSVKRKIALNIPIYSTTNTYMVWRNAGVVKYIHPDDIYGDFPEFEPSPEHKVGQLELLTPAFVRTDLPHFVKNHSDERRIILSITCDPDLSQRHTEEIKKTKHYLIEDYVIGNFYQF